MNNCPTEFKENCYNESIKCIECSAGPYKNNILYYKPIVSKTEHPQTIAARLEKVEEKRKIRQDKSLKKKTNKSKYTKKAFKTEKSIINKINKEVSFAKTTVNSGAVFNDGDAELTKLKEIFGTKINLDVKTSRVNQDFILTYREYQKGLGQDVAVWPLVNNKNEIIYAIEEKLFYKIMQKLIEEPYE
jgi:hypothetical protein